MRVFVFTYDRWDSITTAQALAAAGADYTVLCHDDEARARYVAAGRVEPERIEASGAAPGLAHNRNAALDRMTDGEWAVFLVDDWLRCEQLRNYEHHAATGVVRWSDVVADDFKHEIPMSTFLERCEETSTFATELGAHLAGFAAYGNPFFRQRQWRLNILADGRAWVVRKSALRFDPRAQVVDDYAWTAANIQQFGAVVVNQWVLPVCKRYSAGGAGTADQRMARKRQEAAYLVEKYPGLVRFASKPGWEPGTHITIRATGDARPRALAR